MTSVEQRKADAGAAASTAIRLVPHCGAPTGVGWGMPWKLVRSFAERSRQMRREAREGICWLSVFPKAARCPLRRVKRGEISQLAA